MIQDTIQKIEAKLKNNASIQPENRAELIELLGKLRDEINGLAQTDSEGAQTIAGFTEVSAHEATRVQRNPELVELSLKGLSRSVDDFEKSHPRLVEVVNRFCTTLSNMGI